MAKKSGRTTTGRRARNGARTAFGTIHVSRANSIFAFTGLAAITAGYVLLARGSTVAAPLLLVLGYAVLVPLAIMR